MKYFLAIFMVMMFVVISISTSGVSMAFAEVDFFTTLFGTTNDSNNNADDGLFYGFVTVSIDNDGNVYTIDIAKQRIQKFSSDGDFLERWDSSGTGDGKFASPTKMAFDSDGNVYVSDRLNNNIQKFSSDGDFLAKWDGYDFEKGNGQFTHPQFITIDSDDNMYVLDTASLSILKFTTSGEFIASWDVYDIDEEDDVSGYDKTPHILSVDSNDNLYVADLYQIQKFSSEGTLVSKWNTHDSVIEGLPNSFVMSIDFSGNSYAVDAQQQTISQFSSEGVKSSAKVFESLDFAKIPMQFMLGMQFDKEGNFYVFDLFDFNVKKFDRDGNLVVSFGGKADFADEIRHPNSVGVDSKDNVYVETKNEIVKFSSDGNVISRLNLTINEIEFTGLTNILFDSYDNMYVSNQQSRIASFTSDGSFIKEYDVFRATEDYFMPSIGIAIDSKNNIYAIDSDENKILKFTGDENLVAEWKPQDTKEESSSLTPTAIAIDRQDNIYVAYQVSVIQKFSPDGNLIKEWTSPTDSENGKFFNIFAMATDSKNNLYVASLEHDKIIQFSPEGKFLTEWGFSGSGVGTFNGIKGIAIDSNDNVYVSDYGNHMIQKFQKDSIFITKEKNSTPIADAGKDQHVDEGTQITLDGTNSVDSDETISGTDGIPEQIRLEWKQIGGPVAKLSDKTIVNPIVEIPIIDEDDAVLSFELTVTDYVGASSSDVVDIHVKAKSNTTESISLEPINLSSNSDDNTNTSDVVIATSGNFVYVLWSESTPDSTELLLRVSSDGGTTFKDATSIWKTSSYVSDLSAISSGNNIYAVWAEGVYGQKSLLLASSNDNGMTFSQPVRFSDPGMSTEILALNDSVYVAWTPLDSETNSRNTIHLKASHDAGNVFAEKMEMQVSEKSISGIHMFSSQDRIHMIWSSLDGSQEGSAYYMQSTDELGNGFEEPVKIDPNVFFCRFCQGIW